MSAPQIGLYLRLSREDAGERESQSIETQRMLLAQFASARGWQVKKTYIDDGWSGVRFDRPGFERLIADIERGEIDTVVVKDLSRLGRNYARVGALLEEYFPMHGVRVLSVSEGYDSGAPDGVTDFAPFLSVFNDMYARDISKKVRAALDARRREGKFIGAQPPFGYRRDPEDKNRLVPDPQTAPDVRQVFETYLACGALSGTAGKLTAQGVPTPSQRRGQAHGSRAWSAQTVRRILENPTYAGHLTQGRVRTISYKVRRRVALPQDEWAVVRNTHAPLIDQQTFDRVQEMLRVRSYHPSGQAPHVLTGLVFCGDCGAPMTHVRDGKRVYLVCSGYRRRTGCTPHRVREDAVLDAVRGCLRGMAGEITIEESALLREWNEAQTEAVRATRQAQNRAEACERALLRLYEESEPDEVLLERARQMLRQTRAEVVRCKQQACALPDLGEQIREILRFDVLRRADALALLECVRIFEGRGVEFTFRFAPPKEKGVKNPSSPIIG